MDAFQFNEIRDRLDTIIEKISRVADCLELWYGKPKVWTNEQEHEENEDGIFDREESTRTGTW